MSPISSLTKQKNKKQKKQAYWKETVHDKIRTKKLAIGQKTKIFKLYKVIQPSEAGGAIANNRDLCHTGLDSHRGALEG